MAQAAWCSICGTHVYVTEDGTCPEGHGRGMLSDYYDVPDEVAAEAAADAAAPDAASGAEGEPEAEPQEMPAPPAPVAPTAPVTPSGAPAAGSSSHSRGPLIVMIIVVLLLCLIASCGVVGVWMLTNIDSSDMTADMLEEEFEVPLEEEILSETPELDPTAYMEGAQADIDRMVEHFYPWFESQSFYLVERPDTEDGEATFHIIAAYKNDPAFVITFFAQRTGADAPAGSEVEGQAYYDEEAGVWWLHPQTRDHALDSAFGPNALMVESMLDQIAADFTSTNPDRAITRVSALTNVDLGFQGITLEDLENWYDDGESFESTWKLDISSDPSVWRESSYEEF